MSAQKTGTPAREKPSAMHLQRHGLAGAGGAGDQAVAVGVLERQVFGPGAGAEIDLVVDEHEAPRARWAPYSHALACDQKTCGLDVGDEAPTSAETNKQGRSPMKCPVDNAELVMSERHGIEIDYCPQCRGVWLDRGELDKIIERAAPQETRPAPSRRATKSAVPNPATKAATTATATIAKSPKSANYSSATV